MIFTGTERLETLPIVIFDCQATGASPERGHLIDIAWCRMSANRSKPVIESTTVRLPPDEIIPSRVARITGITDEDLAAAPSRHEAAVQLTRAMDAWGEGLAVAHWARYERAFVHDLLATELDWLCTHNLARRLIPGLPRKGLRAVAGFFGRPLDEAKRAREHVDATAFVWRELVGLLSEEGVETLEELWRWLEQPVRKSDERTYPLPRETRLALPDQPGVYRMLGRDRRVLYVGKATSLKDRVNSYFRKRRLAERKMELVSQVWDLDVTITDSALEAALLEADEIKRLSPPYNRQLREEGRAIVWANPENLRDVIHREDDTHTLGPLPSRATCTHFADLLDFLDGREPLRWYSESDYEAVERGRTAFLQRYDIDPSAPETLRSLGEALYPLPDADNDDEPEIDAVTEASVVETLEKSAVALYRAIARGEWLRRLSRCSIRWQPVGADQARCTVALDAQSTSLAVDEYDRVSVVAAEIRRILRDGRDIEIELDGRSWSRDDLAQAFERF